MSMKTEHTPGPWHTERGLSSTGATPIRDAERVNVAWVCGSDAIDGTPQKAKANAEFIVRACNAHDELVAALEKQVAHTEQLAGMANRFAAQLGLGKKVNPEDWTDQARAALAKAKGQQ